MSPALLFVYRTGLQESYESAREVCGLFITRITMPILDAIISELRDAARKGAGDWLSTPLEKSLRKGNVSRYPKWHFLRYWLDTKRLLDT